MDGPIGLYAWWLNALLSAVAFGESKMRAFIILLVGMILLSSCGDSPASSNKSNNLTLSDFIFKDQDLPRNCRIAPVETTEELPCGAKSNPFLSSERRFLDCFAGELLHDKAVVATTRSALFSVTWEEMRSAFLDWSLTQKPQLAKR
jgi:hypothetical protein